MSRISSFVEESRAEFRRINWPTMRETVRLTTVVIGMYLCVAAFLGAIDFGLLYGLNRYILR